MTSICYWKKNAMRWEQSRYLSVMSRWTFPNLRLRKAYASFIINQIPPGSNVIDVGCGSGLFFESLSNKHLINYTGYDICETSIQSAKDKFSIYKNANWICCNVDDIKNVSADYVVCLGLVDWLSDEQLIQFIKNNNLIYSIYSFSSRAKSFYLYIHKVFTFIQNKYNNKNYNPRRFHVYEIQKLLVGHSIISNRELGICQFAVKMPASILFKYSTFKVSKYFHAKKTGIVEKIIKMYEKKSVGKLLNQFNNIEALDIGSGQYDYANQLIVKDSIKLTALDIDAKFENIKITKNISVYKKYFESTSFNNKFDLIMILGVLEFVEDVDSFLEKAIGLLDINGRMIILVPKEVGIFYLLYKFFHYKNGVNINCLLNKKLFNFIKYKNLKYRQLSASITSQIYVLSFYE